MNAHEKDDVKNSENQVGKQILISHSIQLFKIIKDFSHIMTYKDVQKLGRSIKHSLVHVFW
jgi:hypothetical protein